jgi:hypothetical protein
VVAGHDHVDLGWHGGNIALVSSDHAIPFRRQVVEGTHMKHSRSQDETGIRRASFSKMLENRDSIIPTERQPTGAQIAATSGRSNTVVPAMSVQEWHLARRWRLDAALSPSLETALAFSGFWWGRASVVSARANRIPRIRLSPVYVIRTVVRVSRATPTPIRLVLRRIVHAT